MAGDNRGCSSLFRRAEQLKRWEESETNNELVTDRVKKRKVKFSDGCIFLAAAAAGDKDELHRLLNRGADVNTVNQDGITALHAACIDNNMEIVEFLVDNGADINRSDMEGWTPLHATASCGSCTMAKFLIDRGADLSVVNNDGELAIDVIEEDEMGRILQEEMDIRGVDCDASRSREERNMLEDAQCWLGQGQITEKSHPKTGATALHVAAAKGYIRVMRLLIQAGADVNAKDFDGWTPLHASVHWGQTESVEILCDSMANMDLINYVGQTPYDLGDDCLRPLLDELKRKQASIKLITQNKVSLKKQRLSVKDSDRYGSDGTSSDDSSDSVERKPSTPADQSEIQSWRRPLTNQRKVEEKITDSKEDSTVSFNSNEKLPKEVKKDDGYCIDVPKSVEVNVTSNVSATTVSSPSRLTNSLLHTNRSLVAPSRDDESETQRKAHAKMVRSTRRSTQGITLEDVRSAEQFMRAKQDLTPNSVNADKTEPQSFSLEDARPKDKPKEDENSVESNISAKKPIEDKKDKSEEKTSTTREGTQAVIHRKKKAKRRSTGVVHVDMDEIDPDRKKNSSKEDGDRPNASEREVADSTKSRKGSAENGDIDYKKLYDEQLTENDRLMNRLRSYEKELRQARETLSNNNKMVSSRNAAAESDRREKRSLERKLSEMEEELRLMQKLKAENEKLRAENRALTRVVSKLTNSASLANINK